MRPGFSIIGTFQRRRRVTFLFFLLGLGLVQPTLAQGAGQVQQILRNAQSAMDQGDYARAVGEYEKAVQLAPDNLAANRGLVLSNLQAGRLREAAHAGSAATERWPDDPALLHWVGLVYFKAGQNERALETLQHSAKLDGSHYDIHFDLALVMLTLNQYAPAAGELEKAVQQKPSEVLPHVLLGRAYQNSNRTLQAVEQFKLALHLDPNTKLGHYHLGFAYASLGRNPEAIAEYEKELVRNPQDAEVLYQLGHCLIESGDWKSAVGYLQKSVASDASSADAFYDLGKAYLLRGDAANAVPALRRAIALKPNDPSPHFQLARALEKAGSPVDAKEEMQRFAELKRAQPQAGGMATGRIQ